ncbi:MAG: PAS domain S-box protein [Pseudomonadota bacterium]
MRDQAKTKQQLIAELEQLRQRLAQAPQPPAPQALASASAYRQVFAQAALGMALVSPQGRFQQVNRHLCEMLGYSEHELCALHVNDLTHPDDLEATLRHLRHLRRGPRVVQQERRFVHRYGHALWVLVKSTLVSDQEGRLQYVISLFMDITQQKAAEAALHESEEKYRTIFETAGSAMVIMEEDTTILLANTEFARLTGVRKEDLDGKRSWTEFIASHDVRRMLGYHRLRRVDPGAAPRAYEAQVRDNQGGLHDCLVTVAVVPGTRRSVASLLDLTERKQAEAERALLATAISQAAEAVLVSDRQGRVQYANPAMERLSGSLRQDLEGRNLRLLDQGPAFPDEMWMALTRGEAWTGRTSGRDGQGAALAVEASLSPVRDQGGELVNFVLVQRDVTHEARLEAQLRQAQKMEAIGTLAGGVAHDFNNILASVLGFTEIALHDYLEPGHPARSPLEEVVRAGKRARDLADQILTFSRRRGEERLPLSLAPVLKEALKLLRASLPSTIQIQARLDEQTGPVLADPTQMHQVIFNLCANAAQAMGQTGGVLEVGLERRDISQEQALALPGLEPGPHVILSVADDGQGMAPEVLERVFEPYFTTKGPGEGTGLGLAVVHGIVKSHRGAIRVRSQSGLGTTFQVFFPQAQEGRQLPVPSDVMAPRGRERVLLVEDEPEVAAMTSTMLGNLCYQVSTFTDSQEALAAFERQPQDCDLVLTDQTMPHLTGAELAQRLLTLRPELPVILCSGYSEMVSPEQARSLGIRQFLKKPIMRQELALALRRALEER